MNNELNQIWQLALSEIEKNLSRPSFETWLKTTKPVSIHDQSILVEVPNEFTRDWMETRYKELIQSIIHKVTSEEYKINFVASPSVESEETFEFLPMKNKQNVASSATYEAPPPLNARYTFDSFVVGNCNRLAHAACLAVAEAPSRAYNPLFIYGGVGLGKTHLLHATGHALINNHGLKRVYYFSSEKFTNEFINAIRDNKTLEFRNKYRNVDVLLIDDIQFLAGKEQTQEEFFHTFNTLYENNRQIVISSDRPPKEIPTLEDRLRSRFEWGLITDIQSPDLETRIAILRKKASTENMEVENEVLQYIAHKIDTNIRELEGALISIVAFSSLTKVPITLELVDEALKNVLSPSKKNISLRRIMQATANHFQIPVEDFKSKKRTSSIAFPRQVAMYLCRELTDVSLPKIGSEFGGRDHTTVIHAHKKIGQELLKNPELKQIIELIKADVINS